MGCTLGARGGLVAEAQPRQEEGDQLRSEVTPFQ